MATLSKLIKKNPVLHFIGRAVNAILSPADLKVTMTSLITNLEQNIEIEKQKNEALAQEIQNTSSNFLAKINNLENELQMEKQKNEALVHESQIAKSDFFKEAIARLESCQINSSQTAEEIKATYNCVLKDAFIVLSSEILETLPLENQVKLIEKIFFALLNLQHRNANLVADLIGEYYPRILSHPDLSEAIAFKIYEYLYGLYWCGASSLSDMKKFDITGVRPFAKYVNDRFPAPIPHPERVLTPQPILNICYFCHYAHFDKGNAIAPIIMSIAKAHALLPDRRIFVYCVQWARDDFAQAFAETDVVVRTLAQQSEYQSLDDIIAQMKADKIDVTITDISSSIATYIFLHRAAPLQIWLELGYPYWSIPQVDWVFLCAKNHQSGFGVPADRCSSFTPMQEEVTLLQECSQSALDEARALLPKNSTIFAVFTRLIKITPAYLDIVRRILSHNPSAHFLVVGTGDPRLIYDFLANEESEGRVTFLHRNVDLNVYGRVVDVFLDTFPFIGGNACREVAIHGKPVVSLYTLDFGRLLLDERDSDLLARSADEYVAIAERLATDPEFYRVKSQTAIALAKKSTNVAETVAHIDGTIKRLI